MERDRGLDWWDGGLGCLGALAAYAGVLGPFRVLHVLGVLVFAVGAGQLVARAGGAWLRSSFNVPTIDGGDENRRPQRFVGILENVAYPLVMVWLGLHRDGGPEAAATVLGGWIGLKTITGWSGWQPETGDEHVGRRRLYLFMLLNAAQVAFGAGAALLIYRVPR